VTKIDTLILGAGPTGITAALELHKAGQTLAVIEKNACVGGLARTLQFGKFKTDIGPHRFFSKNQYLYDLIEELLGEKWIKVNRLTKFYIKGKFFIYPVQLKNAIMNVGPIEAYKIISDYLFERTKKIIKRQNSYASFEGKIVSDFGRTLAELNMLNYTEKVWGLPCAQISPDWATQRIKGLSLVAVIKNALFGSKSSPKTLVEQFYYPELGTGLIYEAMREKITSQQPQAQISFNTEVAGLTADNENITSVLVKSEDTHQPIPIKSRNIISSIPITDLVNLLSPKPPAAVLEAANNLKYRSHVSLFITLNQKTVFPDQWIYVPDKEIPFGRIMEPINFSSKMSPLNQTSLLIEFFCWENDTIWNASEQELLAMSLPWLNKHHFIKLEDIIKSFIHKEKYAYPVYDLSYKTNIDKIITYLNRFKNLQCIGRAGRYKYNNQDHAMEMGILAARNLTQNKHYDLDEVGADNEYFEKGYVK
jgi:protoporphyrinogen oxidase